MWNTLLWPSAPFLLSIKLGQSQKVIDEKSWALQASRTFMPEEWPSFRKKTLATACIRDIGKRMTMQTDMIILFPKPTLHTSPSHKLRIPEFTSTVCLDNRAKEQATLHSCKNNCIPEFLNMPWLILHCPCPQHACMPYAHPVVKLGGENRATKSSTGSDKITMHLLLIIWTVMEHHSSRPSQQQQQQPRSLMSGVR